MGGRAKAAKMTAQERSEQAREMNKARWAGMSAEERSAFARRIRKGKKKRKKKG
jgi:hypothetical protein